MTDQCLHCTARGDIEKCESLECSIHENWYTKKLKEINKNLEIDLVKDINRYLEKKEIPIQICSGEYK